MILSRPPQMTICSHCGGAALNYSPWHNRLTRPQTDRIVQAVIYLHLYESDTNHDQLPHSATG